MGILNFFSSKDPEDYEKKGDALFESGAYGKAIAEYERALERLEKSSPWDDGYRQSLRDKIGSCKEQLALEHENTATELMEAGHNDDARQYIELAQELTRDDQLKAKLEQHLKQLDTSDLEAIQATLPNFDNLDQEAEPEDETVAPEQDDEHFTALIGTLQLPGSF
jgi:tetratricopeptide (TPR) repeat protein